MRAIKLSQKGDSSSGEVYRLLVAFILAAAVLVIIMNMIATTNKQTIIISEQKLKEGVQSAVKSVGTSTKIPFVIEDLMLTGTITKDKISTYSGMPKQCIGFVGGQGLVLLENGNLKIKSNTLELDLWAYCDFWDSSGRLPEELDDLMNYEFRPGNDCQTYCVFLFNKKPSCELYDNCPNN